jgi:hypothetical protein
MAVVSSQNLPGRTRRAEVRGGYDSGIPDDRRQVVRRSRETPSSDRRPRRSHHRRLSHSILSGVTGSARAYAKFCAGRFIDHLIEVGVASALPLTINRRPENSFCAG